LVTFQVKLVENTAWESWCFQLISLPERRPALGLRLTILRNSEFVGRETDWNLGRRDVF
jgi:hypothetical protein